MLHRTASSYSMQPNGLNAAKNLELENGENGYAGMTSALVSAYFVGIIVVNDIVANWEKYKDAYPYQVKN
ncbi:hypothetical protein [Agarilytica rhodophyticola]|uniref:hypothetical protein n=1 Tax=Agarilytica rhodophyticola TaxID=1737490 RepID=UPI000B348A9A|nr:hypothetical protein [Agarilytica rhodophyticola]